MRGYVAILALGALALAMPPAPSAEAGGGLSFTTLEPGKTRIIEREMLVNVVFVGYEEGGGDLQIDEEAFLAELPQSYRPTIRLPLYYGITQRLGLEYTYEYKVVFADGGFEDDFFGYLASIADEVPLTAYQEAYNTQENRTGKVTSNCAIDAPSVEQWLAENAGDALGVDTTEYTVFFVNWYGRDDFAYHVYTKTGEPDPDTDVDFGEFDSRKLNAWGGTTPDDEETGLGSLARIWFHDLSAGPVGLTDNWNVDDADLDGDAYSDYRMPPVWEYGKNAGYRAFDDLSGDLGKIARFVAINLLFTTSPLYNPAISAPRLPSSIQVSLNVYQADPDTDGNDYIQPDYVLNELGELQPLTKFNTNSADQKYESRAEQVYESAMTYFYGYDYWDSSYGNRFQGVPLADLYLYHTDHLLKFLNGGADYEVATFCYNLTDDQYLPFLGWTDDNWTDGTVSYVYCLDAPWIRDYGYGLTTTITHEVGHHLGMSHPHDGHDYETGWDYGPSGDLYFVWAGDQCNSMMSYIDLNWDFSQFDRDNMARFLTATYINHANAVLEKVCGSSRASKAQGKLEDADAAAGKALESYAAGDWACAAASAKKCYDLVLAAADSINVKIEPQAHPADYKSHGKSYHFIDSLDYIRLRR